MKYRAIISYDFDAFDHPALGQRRADLAEWIAAFERHFGPATLLIKERRPRRRPRAPAPAQVWSPS